MTVIGSGLGGQIGFAPESTYGTYVAPTRFLEFNSESLKSDVAVVESHGIGSGRWLRTAHKKAYVKAAAGSVEFDVKTKGFGLIFKHMLGVNTITTPGGATNERKHLVTPDAVGKAGLFLTTQVGRPDIGGTSQPYSYPGCKITGWEFKAALDDPLKLSIDLDAKTEDRGQSLASASYATADEIFVMSEGAVTLAGTTIYVKSLSIKGDEALDTDRRFIGNTKKEPLANGEAMVTGQLDFEHEGIARQAQRIAATDVANLIATFTSPTNIEGSAPYKIILTCPLIFFTDGEGAIGGPDIIEESMNFKAVFDGTNPIFSVEYHTTDTAD